MVLTFPCVFFFLAGNVSSNSRQGTESGIGLTTTGHLYSCSPTNLQIQSKDSLFKSRFGGFRQGAKSFLDLLSVGSAVQL